MAFTTGNDTNILQGTDTLYVGAGAGNDRYILAPSNTLASGQIINITDNEGTNTLQLIGGLTITSSVIAATAAQLVLSNGAIVNISGANTFSYEIGGDPLTGTAGTIQNFTSFATTTLGAASVPTGSATTTGTANKTIASTSSTTPTFTVTGATAAAEGTDASFVVSLAGTRSSGVAYGTTVTLAGTGGATAGTDFASALTLDAASTAAGITLSSSGLLSIPSTSSVTSVTLKSAVTADMLTPETGEGMTVTLSAPTGTGAVLGSASSVTTAITDVPVTYTLTASSSSIYEGAPTTYTLTASAAVLVPTDVSFVLVPGDVAAANAGASNTNMADFAAGSFNPSVFTMAAGAKVATYTIATATDSITELPEAYSVQASIGGAVVKTQAFSLLDGTGTPPVATPFVLTTSADSPALTANDDTVTGYVNYLTTTPTATSTLTSSDSINGLGGTNTMNVTVDGVLNNTGAAVAFPVATVSSIQVLNVRNVAAETAAADNLTINADNFPGMTSVYADRSTSTLSVTNLATGATIGVKGNSTVENRDVIFAYKTPTSAVAIAVDGGTKSEVTATATNSAAITNSGTGATAVTITSTGAANTLALLTLAATATVSTIAINATTDLTLGGAVAGNAQVGIVNGALAAAGATLTVTGAGVVDIETMGAALTTVNASANTGGFKAVMNAVTTTKVTGSDTGNDTITTGSVLTTGFAAAGGGTGDRLIVADDTHLTAALSAKYTGFEVLRNNGATDLDVSVLAGITAVEVGSATAGLTKLTAAQAADVKVLATNGTNTFSLTTATGLTDVLGLRLENELVANAATAIDVTAATVTGFETLNVVSSSGTKAGGTGTGNDLAFAAAGDLTAIAVSGAYDLTIASAGVTKVATVTSTQTGTAALYVSGDFAVGSSVTGSGGADAFILGAVGTSYTGGAGNDTMSGTQAQLNTGAVYSAVDGGFGTDTLNLTGNGAITIVDNVLSKVTGFEKIVIADTAANAQSIATGGFFDAAFKVAGVDLTTTSATGNITIDMTSFSGAATITATTADGGAATGVANIQTGSGADKITLTTTATTITNVISTFAGNDTIIGNVGRETITGGTGADTMTGGGGADTYVFAAGDTGIPSITNFDIITDYSKAAGAATFDKIQAGTLVLGAQTGTAGSGVGTITTGLVTFNAADTTFAQHLVAAEAALHATAGNPTLGATVVWQEGTNSYVYISDAVGGVGANDVLIQLTGVTAGALTVAGNVITAMA